MVEHYENIDFEPEKKKRVSPLAIVLVVLMVLIIIAVGLILLILFSGRSGSSNPVTEKINHEVSKKAVETYISNETGNKVSFEEIEEAMSEEDSQEFNEIVDKYSDSGLLNDAIAAYTENGGDVQAVAEEMKDRIDPEDMEAMRELYEKYRDELDQ